MTNLRTLYHPAMYDPAPVPSYWEATAPADDPAWTPLEGDGSCDVAIIGGGYTGLSAALHLARDHGVDVAVLEAGDRIGWGASGRNGGFCCMGATKMSIAEMTRRHGLDETKRYYASQAEGVEFTRALIADNHIDCDARGDGLMDVAHRPRAFGELKEYGETLGKLFGIETSVYSAEEFREIGHDSTEQFGAIKVSPSFALHPLKFAQGLARAASAAGATLHPGSLVTSWLREGGQHLLTTERGTLRAKRIIVAANGFLRERLHRDFDGRILPVISNIVTTRPLTDDELAAQSWKTDCPLINSRKLLFYYAMLPGNRLMLGARGDLTGSPADGDRMRAWMTRRVGEVFPAWRDVEIDHFWRGFVCISQRLAPSVGQLPDDPSVFYGFGYHANGVNTAPWTGMKIAAMVAGKTVEADLPAVMRGLPTRFPFPALRRKYLGAAYRWYAFKDD
ncbi:MAG: FAD-binding oxidoreductase [Proteobacteria bacterium]|nr:FAD-binding oxidoreductase [Pseudomonadota bacterium]